MTLKTNYNGSLVLKDWPQIIFVGLVFEALPINFTIYLFIKLAPKLIFFRVQFSEALPIDLTMMMHCEYPSTLYIGKGGKTTASYVPV